MNDSTDIHITHIIYTNTHTHTIYISKSYNSASKFRTEHNISNNIQCTILYVCVCVISIQILWKTRQSPTQIIIIIINYICFLLTWVYGKLLTVCRLPLTLLNCVDFGVYFVYFEFFRNSNCNRNSNLTDNSSHSRRLSAINLRIDCELCFEFLYCINS